MKVARGILFSALCLIISTTLILNPVLAGPPYYHEEGNVNYPGSFGQSFYMSVGIGVDDYITHVDFLILRRTIGTDSSYPWGTDWDQYNPDADFNGDGQINYIDLGTWGLHWGLNYHYTQFETTPGDIFVMVVPSNLGPIEVGEEFSIEIWVMNAMGVNDYEFTLGWNSELLDLVSAEAGNIFYEYTNLGTIIGEDYIYGVVRSSMSPPPANGEGTLAQITFKCVNAGTTTLDLSSRLFYEYSLSPMPHQDEDGIVVLQDTTPPVAEAGPDQTVDEDTLITFDGSGSYDVAGIASYTWTFIDGTPQTLTGVNPTYTFTTPGIYTVTLDVSDAAGNHAIDTVTITVLSLTPEELMQELIGTIDSWNLPQGTENSLNMKLQAALDLLGKENNAGAVHKLMDFITQVEAFRGKKLTDQQADYLIAEAQRTINQITG